MGVVDIEQVLRREKQETDLTLHPLRILSLGINNYFLTSDLLEAIMPEVRVRQKHQITLPSSIVQEAHIAPNDTLEIALVNGVITLTPTKRQECKDSVMSYAGIFRGAWGATPEEVEKTLRDQRDSWER